jgi:hypothetical protein
MRLSRKYLLSGMSNSLKPLDVPVFLTHSRPISLFGAIKEIVGLGEAGEKDRRNTFDRLSSIA